MCKYCVHCHICCDYPDHLKDSNSSLEDYKIYNIEHEDEFYEVVCPHCENYLCEYHFSLTKTDYPIYNYLDGEAYVKGCYCCQVIKKLK